VYIQSGILSAHGWGGGIRFLRYMRRFTHNKGLAVLYIQILADNKGLPSSYIQARCGLGGRSFDCGPRWDRDASLRMTGGSRQRLSVWKQLKVFKRSHPQTEPDRRSRCCLLLSLLYRACQEAERARGNLSARTELPKTAFLGSAVPLHTNAFVGSNPDIWAPSRLDECIGLLATTEKSSCLKDDDSYSPI
jgi:hypothetical protein